jgi:hypothetical protein
MKFGEILSQLLDFSDYRTILNNNDMEISQVVLNRSGEWAFENEIINPT